MPWWQNNPETEPTTVVVVGHVVAEPGPPWGRTG